MVTNVDGEALASDLQGRVRGPLLMPAEAGYDEARSVWNAMIDRRPALIVRCLGVADVMACVDVARRRGVPHLHQGWWPQHRRTGGARRRPAARHVADARRLGRRAAAAGPGAGRLPAGRRRPRDAGARPGRRARLRLEHRVRRPDARRRVRLPDPPLRLDQRQPDGRSTSSPPTAGWCARRSARTAICSGRCAAAAATSASPPASTTRCIRSARRSSAGRSPGAARMPRRCWRCIAPWRPMRRAS